MKRIFRILMFSLLPLALISCDDGTMEVRKIVESRVSLGDSEEQAIAQITELGWLYTYNPVENSYAIYDPKQNKNKFVRVGVTIQLDEDKKVKNILVESHTNFM